MIYSARPAALCVSQEFEILWILFYLPVPTIAPLNSCSVLTRVILIGASSLETVVSSQLVVLYVAFSAETMIISNFDRPEIGSYLAYIS